LGADDATGTAVSTGVGLAVGVAVGGAVDAAAGEPLGGDGWGADARIFGLLVANHEGVAVAAVECAPEAAVLPGDERSSDVV
jgi:hypothetical protein